MSTNIKNRFVILISVVMCIAFICNTTVAAAAAATSNTDQYVKKVYNTNFVSLFDEYGELKLVRSQTLSSIQGKKLDDPTKEYVDIIVDILINFNDVNILSHSDNVEDHVASLDKAVAIQSKIKKLNEYNEPTEKNYPLLISLSIERYFRSEGAYFQELAGYEKNTLTRANLLEKSAIAYNNAKKLPLYNELSFIAENEKQIYYSDMEAATDSIEVVNDFLIGQKIPDGSYSIGDFITSTNQYAAGSIAKKKNEFAIGIYSKHSNTEDLTLAQNNQYQIENLNSVSFAKVLQYLTIITLIYLLVSLYMLFIVTSWSNDAKNADYGNRLLEGISIA